MTAMFPWRKCACSLAIPWLLSLSAAAATAQRPAGSPLLPAPSAVRATQHDATAVAALLDSVRVAARQDSVMFRRLAAPEFIFIHSSGRVDDVLAFLEFAARIRPDGERVLSPPEYRVYGSAGDVILVLTHTAIQVPGRGWNAYRATDLVQRDPTSPLGWRWVAHQSTRLPSEGNYIQLPGAVLDAYVGRYRAPGEVGARTVGRDGERLLLSSPSGRPLAFRALTESTFGLENGQMYLVFVRDATGNVSHLDVLQLEQAVRWARLPSQ